MTPNQLRQPVNTEVLTLRTLIGQLQSQRNTALDACADALAKNQLQAQQIKLLQQQLEALKPKPEEPKTEGEQPPVAGKPQDEAKKD